MAINPLNFFSVGSQTAGVNSLAAGPAQTIRNILQQAQKKGLLQAQSESQLDTSKQLHQFKVDNPIGAQTRNVNIVNPESGKIIKTFANQPKEDVFKLPTLKTPEDPAVIAARKEFAKRINAGSGGGSTQQTPVAPQAVPTPDEAQAAVRANPNIVGYDPALGAYVDAQGNPIQ